MTCAFCLGSYFSDGFIFIICIWSLSCCNFIYDDIKNEACPNLVWSDCVIWSSAYFLASSKLQSDAVREAISQIVAEVKEKKRNFVETIELQIGLKNYDPQKDKRFSGSVRLPHIPRPKMKVCMLGDAQHVEEVCWTRWLLVGHSCQNSRFDLRFKQKRYESIGEARNI